MTRQIAVISGKGGTGKTTLTAVLARFAKEAVFADCDVDAPNMAMLLSAEIREEIPFFGGKEYEIDDSNCIKCGMCKEVCEFDAIKGEYFIDKFRCEGCGVCHYFCPVESIKVKDRLSGHYYESYTPWGTFIHAKLKPGEENSGKLVNKVRDLAIEKAKGQKSEWIIIDGPPGVGCPVISTITGVDAVLMVTEPTSAGMHDLMRVADLAMHFKIPSAVCINKVDISEEKTSEIRRFCNKKGIFIVGEVPFDKKVVGALMKGKTVIEAGPFYLVDIYKRIWENIKLVATDEKK